MSRSPRWSDVERLIADQQHQAAFDTLEAVRRESLADPAREPEMTEALLKQVQLRVSLGGPETAVRFLLEQPWPRHFLHRTLLELFLGHTLVQYLQHYDWEIRQRTKVVTPDAVDLKQLTCDQILDQAMRAYQRVWRARAELDRTPTSSISAYVEPGNYPAGVRDTLRELASYLAVEILANTSHWRPEQSNDLFRLDLRLLLADRPAESVQIRLDDGELHPLERVCAILDDLEHWNREAGREDAALEARLERARRLHAAFDDPRDRRTLEDDLRARAKGVSARWRPWMAAELSRAARDRGDKAEAHRLASDGAARGGDPLGAERCKAIAHNLEQPDYTVASMASDGLRRRSLEIRHKSLPALHFRAYPVDVDFVLDGRDYNLLPGYQEWRAIVRGDPPKVIASRPACEWRVDLAATPDLELHTTWAVPPIDKPGLYVLVASAKSTFHEGPGNKICAASVMLGDLVLLQGSSHQMDPEAIVVSGDTGAPVSGAEVLLCRRDWNRKHTVAERGKTNDRGEVVFARSSGHPSYFLLARKGGHTAICSNVSLAKDEPEARAGVLVYTDRSVYRPEQRLHFKVIAYQGDDETGRYHVKEGLRCAVTLHDPNGEAAGTETITTHAHGSGSGSFVIPRGRVLGVWRLTVVTSSSTTSVTVHVEAYKRPTFEVRWLDPQTAPRLGHAATMRGDARYYFGAPVSGGRVAWHIERAPKLPPWWFRDTGDMRPQRMAAGVATVAEDGSFEVTFTPEADPRRARDPHVSFTYTLHAELTDDGGETRSATRTLRLGHATVEATVEFEHAFAREAEVLSVRVRRTDLDGAPRAGTGAWRLFAVAQPTDPVPGPADLPGAAPPHEDPAAFHLPGDGQRPRWSTDYTPERAMARWPDGRRVGEGQMVHGTDGVAALLLPPLPPGPYRLRYETRDDHGSRSEAERVFVTVGKTTPLALPAMCEVESTRVEVGGVARVFAASGTHDQVLFLDLFQKGRRIERRVLRPGDPELIELAVDEKVRGGFGVTLHAVRDFQLVRFSRRIAVPWSDRELSFELGSFRDKIRPGAKETFRITVRTASGKPLGAHVAEVLAYMYDRSLDVFAPHTPPAPLRLYPDHARTRTLGSSLGPAHLSSFLTDQLSDDHAANAYVPASFHFFESYAIGGPGNRVLLALPPMYAVGGMPPPAPCAAPAPQAFGPPGGAAAGGPPELEDASPTGAPPPPEGASPGEGAAGPIEVRSNFAETAFFQPHLLTEADGGVTIAFEAPDSVTSWALWLHAITRDVRSAAALHQVRTVKDLVVRPYLPRFFREGDHASVRVVVNNTSERALAGALSIELFDPGTGRDLAPAFALDAPHHAFEAPAGQSATIAFSVRVPAWIGQVGVRVQARAEDLSDGEERALPVLPGRMHLAASRFVTLRGVDRREIRFDDMARGDDASCVHDSLVVTLNAQLFYSVLEALPVLVDYPYECSEQLLNRFVSAGIVAGVYERFPSVAAMARSLPRRTTPLEAFDGEDPNRKMAMEETPWLREARGGEDPKYPLVDLLDPAVVSAHRDATLAKLEEQQTTSGGFPWFPGGPPSPFITLYLLEGMARAAEFGVDVPVPLVTRAWRYLVGHFRADVFPRIRKGEMPHETTTFALYVLCAYGDASSTEGAFTAAERAELLAYAWAGWRKHSPMLKCYLTLVLHRVGRADDARLVLASVMDSARTEPDRGTFWAPEDRAWLWYNDTTESHAFALRALSEVTPDDPRKDGMVLWLLLDKKLGHWKSTRASAAAIYALVHHMAADGSLGARERASVTVGARRQAYVFEPDRHAGNVALVVPGEEIARDPAGHATVLVEKDTPGYLFASATWHFSTERLPGEARGDLFRVERRAFKRVTAGKETVLQPLSDAGVAIAVGDEVEIHLSIRAGHAAEYVHVRDPRPAGFEPESQRSGHRWHLGLSYYEEIRDSGANFFIEWMPAGEYTLKHRLRANMAGVFRAHPATLQSMYAPEFSAYSAGSVVEIGSGG